MKYKVGDKVRIVSEKTGFAWNCALKMDKWLGKVMTIRGISGNAYRMQEDSTESDGCGWYWGEEMIFGLVEPSESIHITRDGSAVQAVHKRGGEIIQRATAKCSPSDTFDFAVGAALAFQRLMHPEVKKAPANKYEGMSDDELSDAICFYSCCDNWGITGKNCPSRTYCHDGKGSYAYILEHRSEAIAYLIAEDEAKAKQDKPSKPDKPAEKHQYKVGDKVKVISRKSNCDAKVGDIVTLTERTPRSDDEDGLAWHYAEQRGYIQECDIEPYTAPAQPEPAKAEPVKLYCVKDYRPGEWTTKGKVYEKQADGRIRFDDGYCVEPMPLGAAAKSLVPLVNRPAKVGEWIYCPKSMGGFTKTGAIYLVSGMAGGTALFYDPASKYPHTNALTESHYLVLDGYQPEPKQPEPKYWSGKAVCVETSGDFTVGRVYEFKDGKVTDDDGDGRSLATYRAESLEAWNKRLGSGVARFIEFKGESHD